MLTVTKTKRIWKETWALLPKDLLVNMLKNQIGIERIDERGDKKGITGNIENGLSIWCAENCNGLYRFSGGYVYFEEETDMIAFKIYWEGKDESEWL